LRRIRARSIAHDAHATVFGAAARIANRLAPAGSRRWRAGQQLAHRLRPQPRHQFEPLIALVAATRPTATFIQVGSNDGEQQDPLRSAILSRSWSGIMVEPVPYVFERLRANYGHLERLSLENVAIGAVDGTATLYHLAQARPDELASLPRWYDALGSFSRDVVRSHASYIPDIEDRIVETPVRVLRFDTLCRIHAIETLDVLHIDTEGHDYEILKLVDLEHLKPLVVIYEHIHLSPADAAACAALVARFGYESLTYGNDVWCLRIGEIASHEVDVVRLWQSLQRECQ
jgi:FkbM family methyltransferase